MDALTLARVRKVCGMLSSEHEGERSAAAAMATRLLRQNGKTWADVVFVDAAGLAQAYSNAALVDILQKGLDSERARTTQMAEEINRLTREVNRLKGMWPSGQPGRAA